MVMAEAADAAAKISTLPGLAPSVSPAPVGPKLPGDDATKAAPVTVVMRPTLPPAMGLVGSEAKKAGRRAEAWTMCLGIIGGGGDSGRPTPAGCGAPAPSRPPVAPWAMSRPRIRCASDEAIDGDGASGGEWDAAGGAAMPREEGELSGDRDD